jgi:hypothetical protein
LSTEDIPLVKRARVTNIDIEFEGIEPTEGKGTTVRRADPWQVEPQKLRDVFRAALDAFQYGHEVDVFTDRFGRIIRIQRVSGTV